MGAPFPGLSAGWWETYLRLVVKLAVQGSFSPGKSLIFVGVRLGEGVDVTGLAC